MSTTPSVNGTSEPTWFKSSYSDSEGGDCVEVATHPGTVHVRDSKDAEGSQLIVTPTSWATFLTHLR
jgi:hypothetical protein